MTEDDRFFAFRRAPVTIAGVVFLGVSASALYDLLLKPGINGGARVLFDALTLGSQQIKDYSFNTAALDPTSLPSLTLLIFLAVFVFLLPFKKVFDHALIKLLGNPREASKRKKRVVLLVVLPILTVMDLFLIFVPLNIVNQSVLTWRAFHANLAIISPHIDEAQRSELEAQFAAMKTEEDYREIEKHLSTLGQPNQVTLRSESPW